MKKTAFITGASGQDGVYLTNFLCKLGYKVICGVRRSSADNLSNLLSFNNGLDFKIEYIDVTDVFSLNNIFEKYEIDELYNLAAMSHVGISFSQPVSTLLVDGLGSLNCLEICKKYNTKFYQASTSELFGKSKSIIMNEKTLFEPVSPYSIAKDYAYKITELYRNAYGLYATNGILFNHESKFRPKNFVTRKITYGVSQIIKGNDNMLHLGNLSSIRDWGHSLDYVKAMHLILQQEKPSDYIVSTGVICSVREFLKKVWEFFGYSINFENSGLNEELRIISSPKDKKNLDGKIVCKVSEKFFRPMDVPYLKGDSNKIRKIGWKPEIGLDQLIEEMCTFDFYEN